MVLNFVIVPSRCLQCFSWDCVRSLAGPWQPFLPPANFRLLLLQAQKLGRKDHCERRKFAEGRDCNPNPHHHFVQATWITGLNHVFLQDLAGFCPMTSESDRQNLWILWHDVQRWRSRQQRHRLRTEQVRRPDLPVQLQPI
jgi:hypothetical protein